MAAACSSHDGKNLMKSRKKTRSKAPAANLLMQFGPMRVVLACTALALIVFVPMPGTTPIYSGWAMVPTIIVPVLAPNIFMVVLLDVLMSSIFMIDKKGAERARYRRIQLTELALAAGMVVFWVPYFKALIR